MADAEKEEQVAEEVQKDVEDEDEHDNPNYKPPAPKALDEIMNADAEDESLVKYKEALLGQSTKDQIIIDPSKKTVIVNKMSLLVDGREPLCMDLTKTPEELKGTSYTMKEGVFYKIQIGFQVQKEIVTGLKYEHKVYRKGIKVDSMKYMMGSYGPRLEGFDNTTTESEAPKGMLARGDYKIKSHFKDDDDNDYCSWEWNLSIKKDW